MILVPEYEIGSRLVFDKLIYEVCPADSCLGCSQYIEHENHCLDYNGRFGCCCGTFRRDGQDVIFVHVGFED